jgi:tetratricopeptide (TPR) repeat protein
MTAENNNKGYLKIVHLIIGTIFLLFLGCSGGREFRVEFASDGNSAAKLQKLAENQTQGDSLAKNLPEMTYDEYERLGDALLRKKNLHMAYFQYEKSLELNPENIRVQYKQGLVWLYAHKNDDAIKQFLAVLEKEPNFALAFEGIGRSYLQKKAYDEAETYFLKALIIDPKLWRTHIFLGYIYDHRKDYQAAVSEYKSAISEQPDNGLIYNNLGISYSMTGEYKKAVKSYNKAIELRYREPRVYNNLALALANLGRYEETLEAFKEAGGEAQAYNNLGCIFLNLRKYKNAEQCFKKAIELKPTFYAKALENMKKAKAGNVTLQ